MGEPIEVSTGEVEERCGVRVTPEFKKADLGALLGQNAPKLGFEPLACDQDPGHVGSHTWHGHPPGTNPNTIIVSWNDEGEVALAIDPGGP